MSCARYSDQLSQIAMQGRTRFLRPLDGAQEKNISYQGASFLNFSSNNYLGLANHPRVVAAAKQALQDYGFGAGAARLVNGDFVLSEKLEAALAEFKSMPAALLFNSGYLANVGALSSLIQEGDVVFSDALNHASIIDGLRLSKGRRVIYSHVDLEDLRKRLQEWKSPRRAGQVFWIVTESVFSMDGDLAPMRDLLDLAKEFDAMLYVDEAHATGIFGARGAGCCEELSGDEYFQEHAIVMGTLSKAIGAYGAYVAAAKDYIDYLLQSARPFIFTTGLPPSLLAGALEALKIIQSEPQRRESLWKNIRILDEKFREIFPEQRRVVSPIIPWIVGEENLAVSLSQKLFGQGYWVSAIRPPTVAPGTSRLRLTLMSTHREGEILGLVGGLEETMKNFKNGGSLFPPLNFKRGPGGV